MHYAMLDWMEDIERCARLTATDGIVVFDTLLNPRGFGAKVSNRTPGETISPECKEYLSVRGLRHTSTAIATDGLGDALGFVVSQDGNVTMFVKDDPEALLRHESLRF
jgi:hypothetical protein